MILVKGKEVHLEMEDGRWIVPSESYGLIHDPEGTQLPPCVVFVGPYTMSKSPAVMTKNAKTYFGPDVACRRTHVDIPNGPWEPVGSAVQIKYRRPGEHRGRYYHPFDTGDRWWNFFKDPTVIAVARCRSMYRIGLPDGCVVNWRGFVTP